MQTKDSMRAFVERFTMESPNDNATAPTDSNQGPSNANRSNNKKRNRNKKKPPPSQDALANAMIPSQAIRQTNNTAKIDDKKKNGPNQSAADKDATPATTPAGKRNGRRRGKKGNQGATTPQESPKTDNAATNDPTTTTNNNNNKKVNDKKKNTRKRNNNNNNKKKQKQTWRQHVPPDAVDPITLDPLKSLSYPPFCLVANEPYEVVEEWPIPENQTPDNTTKPLVDETEEERQERILREQWGGKVTVTDNDKSKESTDNDDVKPPSSNRRHYHLYDGRALAYYMVSQLQFIDPLNRRDLTRDELVHLDRYLRKHGFGTAATVTEAYDSKGVTLSTAGATAATAAGRAAILQQEASVLLQALFGGTSVAAPRSAAQSTARNATPQSNFGALYRAYETQQQQEEEQRLQRQQEQSLFMSSTGADRGVYTSGGLTLIDDDINMGEGMGLRPNAPSFVPPDQAADGVGTLWSASHITSRHGQGTVGAAEDFPSLSALSRPNESSSTEPPKASAAQKPLPPSKTLARIGSAVKKTDPQELQRQWEAREEARRRAMMSNLTFGSNVVANLDRQEQLRMDAQVIPSTITTTQEAQLPTEAQLERNKALADALGVAPATVRRSINTGWARPSESKKELDEFGNELNTIIYPDTLIIQARERMTALLKLEKKWKTFLADDSAASLPLNSMDRPMRAFVHEYSDYWKLHTESFDPEPKRYIHCVKLRDTSAPYPLLSEAARNWRGPRPILQNTLGIISKPSVTRPGETDHTNRQTAGQNTHSVRELPLPPERTPLQLKPRGPGTVAIVADSNDTGAFTIGGSAPRSLSNNDEGVNSRFDSLADGRERPKLQLQKRTVPLELPPMEQTAIPFVDQEDVKKRRERLAAKARREQELADRQRKVLEAAFASDEEDNSTSEREAQGAGFEDLDSVVSDWEEQVPAEFSDCEGET